VCVLLMMVMNNAEGEEEGFGVRVRERDIYSLVVSFFLFFLDSSSKTSNFSLQIIIFVPT